jgi:hypothetical protein
MATNSYGSVTTGRFLKTALGLQSGKGKGFWKLQFMPPGDTYELGIGDASFKEQNRFQQYFVLRSCSNATRRQYVMSNQILYSIPGSSVPQNDTANDLINNDPKLIALRKYYDFPAFNYENIIQDNDNDRRVGDYSGSSVPDGSCKLAGGKSRRRKSRKNKKHNKKTYRR